MTLDVTFTDLFCGVGGSTSGAMDAGFIGKLGVNHWERAIVCLIQEKNQRNKMPNPPFPFGRLQLHPDQISKRSLERAGIEWLECEMHRCRNSLFYAIRNKNEYGAFCYSRELARVGFEYLRRTDPTNHSLSLIHI